MTRRGAPSPGLLLRVATLAVVAVAGVVPAVLVPSSGSALAAGLADGAAAAAAVLVPGSATSAATVVALGGDLGFALPHHSDWLALTVGLSAALLFGVYSLLALGATVPTGADVDPLVWRQHARHGLGGVVAAGLIGAGVELVVIAVGPGRDLSLRIAGVFALAVVFALPVLVRRPAGPAG